MPFFKKVNNFPRLLKSLLLLYTTFVGIEIMNLMYYEECKVETQEKKELSFFYI